MFDREGDIAEVFEEVRITPNTGVVVRASHNRALSEENSYLRESLQEQPVQMEVTVELPKTQKRTARTAILAIKYAPLKLKSPARIKEREYFEVYVVHAREIDPPSGCEPVEWMLLTTEPVTKRRKF